MTHEEGFNQKTQMLIDANYYWEIVTGKVAKLRNKVTGTETIFGCTVQEPSRVEGKLVTCTQ